MLKKLSEKMVETQEPNGQEIEQSFGNSAHPSPLETWIHPQVTRSMQDQSMIISASWIFKYEA